MDLQLPIIKINNVENNQKSTNQFYKRSKSNINKNSIKNANSNSSSKNNAISLFNSSDSNKYNSFTKLDSVNDSKFQFYYILENSISFSIISNKSLQEGLKNSSLQLNNVCCNISIAMLFKKINSFFSEFSRKMNAEILNNNDNLNNKDNIDSNDDKFRDKIKKSDFNLTKSSDKLNLLNVNTLEELELNLTSIYNYFIKNSSYKCENDRLNICKSKLLQEKNELELENHLLKASLIKIKEKFLYDNI